MLLEINPIIPILPDPWELPNPTPSEIDAKIWQISGEVPPLITGAVNPKALQIMPPHSNLLQFLLQDWLKLKTKKAKPLTNQFEEALGLLYWIGWAV